MVARGFFELVAFGCEGSELGVKRGLFRSEGVELGRELRKPSIKGLGCLLLGCFQFAHLRLQCHACILQTTNLKGSLIEMEGC